MIKDVKYKLGLFVAGFIGIISSVPRYVLNPTDSTLEESAYLFFFAFGYCFLSWLLNFNLLNFKSANALNDKIRISNSAIKVCISIFGGLLAAALVAFILHFILDDKPYLERYDTFFQLLGWACFRFSLINGFVIVLKYTMDSNDEKRDIKIAHEKLKKENLLAQFEALKQQLNPHFLFNSLSSLSSMIKQNHEASAEFVLRLSHVYRYLLKHNNEDVVTLDQELLFMDAYLFLLNSRFGTSFNVDIAIDRSDLQRYGIPVLSLQLLVENAIKHNVVSSHRPLSIHIEIENEYLKVSNNLQLRSTHAIEESNGIGLGSINRRYELLSEKNIEITSNNEIFMVKLPLLKRS